ncbi:hypothetical protein DFAR_200044 [Desulfarculales bacterium]
MMGQLHMALLAHLGHVTLSVDSMAAKRRLALELGARVAVLLWEAAEAMK